MSIRYKMIFLLTVFAFLGISAFRGFAESSDYGAKGALKQSDLGLDMMLAYAIQDEYLAKGEYELIMSRYGTIRPFSNIVKSEEQHVRFLVDLFNTHGFSVPEDIAKDHVVLPQNLKSALGTGVQAEIENIAMYEAFLKQELPADVRHVFERLKSASENHLRAFKNNLRKYS